MDIAFIEKTLLVSLIVIFIWVFYKWLLRYLKRKEIPARFGYLHPIGSPFSGEVIIKVDTLLKGRIAGELNGGEGKIYYLFEADKFAGTHEFMIDSKTIPNGSYLLVITLPDQKISRKIMVEN